MIKRMVIGVLLVSFILMFYFFYHPTAPIILKKSNFNQLPNFNRTNLKPSFEILLKSCESLLKKPPTKFIGTKKIQLYAGDFKEICEHAKLIDKQSNKDISIFF